MSWPRFRKAKPSAESYFRPRHPEPPGSYPRDRHTQGAPLPTDRLFASLVFDPSYFYAIVADFRTRVRDLFLKPRYSVLMSSHHSRSGVVGGI